MPDAMNVQTLRKEWHAAAHDNENYFIFYAWKCRYDTFMVACHECWCCWRPRNFLSLNFLCLATTYTTQPYPSSTLSVFPPPPAHSRCRWHAMYPCSTRCGYGTDTWLHGALFDLVFKLTDGTLRASPTCRKRQAHIGIFAIHDRNWVHHSRSTAKIRFKLLGFVYIVIGCGVVWSA